MQSDMLMQPVSASDPGHYVCLLSRILRVLCDELSKTSDVILCFHLLSTLTIVLDRYKNCLVSAEHRIEHGKDEDSVQYSSLTAVDRSPVAIGDTTVCSR